MLKIREDKIRKIGFGLAGLAAGTLVMKTIEKSINTPTVSGLLGLEGVSTLQDIAPPVIVGVIGAGYYTKNSTKDHGFIGMGAAMAAGAKVVEKFANKTIFSGLGEAQDVEYYEDSYLPATNSYSGASLDDYEEVSGLESIPLDDIL